MMAIGKINLTEVSCIHSLSSIPINNYGVFPKQAGLAFLEGIYVQASVIQSDKVL